MPLASCLPSEDTSQGKDRWIGALRPFGIFQCAGGSAIVSITFEAHAVRLAFEPGISNYENATQHHY